MIVSVYEEKEFPQYVTAIISAIGSLIVGLSLGWSAPAELRLTENQEYNFYVSKNQFYWIASIMTLGAGIACIPMGFLINYLGRKRFIVLITFPNIIGWIFLYSGNQVFLLYVGRFILGITAAGYCTALPMYIAEISNKNIRGLLTSFFQLSISTGVFLSYALGWPLSLFTLTLISGLLPIIFLGCFLFLPESPMYLLNTGKREKAIKSLKWLRGENCDYETEIQYLTSEKYSQIKGLSSVWCAITRKESIKAIIHGCFLMFFQQLSGINVVVFYTNQVFQSAKINIPDGAATSMVGLMQILANLVGLSIIDKLGRKLSLSFSTLSLGIVTTLIGGYFYVEDTNPEYLNDYRWLPVLLLCLFNFLFALGLGPVPWIMMGELFPPDIKGISGSIAGTTNWLLAFFVTSTYGNLKNSIGTGQTFWLYACISYVGTLFAIFILPETKGKSLIEIQELLQRNQICF